ncbi:ABC transporter permease [Nocardiopsis coralliicola]
MTTAPAQPAATAAEPVRRGPAAREPLPAPPGPAGALRGALRDGAIVAGRNLVNMRRTPGKWVTGLIQPLIFVFLLAFVFGGSLGGDAYREFLIAGVFVQTITFGASFTAIGLAADLQQGVVDRFRTLPMSRWGVILGRTLSDLCVSAASVAVVAVFGLAIGWRAGEGVLAAAAGFAVLVLFAFAVAWIGAVIGLFARSAEVAQSMGLIWLFPVTFLSGAFVSLDSLPAPLRIVAEWNPVTAVAAAARELFGNAPPPGFGASAAWPGQQPLLYAVLSSAALVAVFAPLALARFRRISRG